LVEEVEAGDTKGGVEAPATPNVPIVIARRPAPICLAVPLRAPDLGSRSVKCFFTFGRFMSSPPFLQFSIPKNW